MSERSNEFLESLFQGIDILIDKSLEGLSYDTTEICTIIDDSNAKNGVYQVTNGSVVSYDRPSRLLSIKISIP